MGSPIVAADILARQVEYVVFEQDCSDENKLERGAVGSSRASIPQISMPIPPRWTRSVRSEGSGGIADACIASAMYGELGNKLVSARVSDIDECNR